MQGETQKVWDQAAVHQLLETNAMALAKAVITIYQRQTASEKDARTTTEANGVGFSGFDAEFLSDIAVKLPRYDMRLTPKQRARVLPMMKRYWRQLLDEIEKKGGQVRYKPLPKTAAKSLNRPVAMAKPALPGDDLAAALAKLTNRAPTRGELARSFGF